MDVSDTGLSLFKFPKKLNGVVNAAGVAVSVFSEVDDSSAGFGVENEPNGVSVEEAVLFEDELEAPLPN